MIFDKASWISSESNSDGACPVFKKEFAANGRVKSAQINIAARGVYKIKLNSDNVGDFVLAPGWTEYEKRIQYQTYDITDMLSEQNEIEITLGSGWYCGRITGGVDTWHESDPNRFDRIISLIAAIVIEYDDAPVEHIYTDESWSVGKGAFVFGDIYDGEIYDATRELKTDSFAVLSANRDKSVLIPTEGEKITEHERIKGQRLIITPRGERVIDFGQNLTGYPEISLTAKASQRVRLSFAEILDKDGNFYNENYRSAKSLFEYTCKDGYQTYKPSFTFYGFRYIRIDEYPTQSIAPSDFTAIAIYSDMKRIGHFYSSDDMLNKLYSNIIWGQKSNYVDVPMDCPQRDERFGYTGDAQVFIKTACRSFDIGRFFKKWFADVMCVQSESGAVEAIAPQVYGCKVVSAGWGDAITICPWEIYLAYGDKSILEMTYPAMKKWIAYIEDTTTSRDEWTGGHQFGDWLEMTGKGNESDKSLIATAFYAYSCMLTYKTGKVIGERSDIYLEKFNRIKNRFIEKYEPKLKTQTELCLALSFGLTDREADLAEKLRERVIADGRHLTTGFLGTPYLLHALTDYGYTDLAYELLLRREYPSWLYCVDKGATTMWERWDSVKPDGPPADKGMNSFNHYAYGAVGAWLYVKAAGICILEQYPGYERVMFSPHVSDKIDYLGAKIETLCGTVSSSWRHENGKIVYEFISPAPCAALIDGEEIELNIGKNIIIR